jgi:hypothetical protein
MGQQASKSDCLLIEKEGRAYWQNGKCQAFTKEVCDSIGGYWSPGTTDYCMNNARYVESGEPIRKRDMEQWDSVRGENLQRLLDKACDERWEECSGVVTVHLE